MAVTARLSKSGQLTMPAEIRESLGVKPGDTVIWQVDEHGSAKVTPVKLTFEQLRGIAGPPRDGKDLMTTIDEAMQEWGKAKLRELEELSR